MEENGKSDSKRYTTPSLKYTWCNRKSLHVMSVLLEMIIEREMCQLNRWRRERVGSGAAMNAFN